MANFGTWYRREDYDRIRKIMDDGDKLPKTFDEWEKNAKSTVARAASQGITLKPVIIDPDEFIAFCDAQKIPRGSEARARFMALRGTAKDLN